MKRIDLPEILKPFYFDFHWSQKKLWALGLPTETMPIADFEWLLDYPIWPSNPPLAIFDLCPRDFIRSPNSFPLHQRKVENANTCFPIHVMHWKGRWVIMDGFHRLIQLMNQGQTEVRVHKVPQAAIPEIAPDPTQLSGYAPKSR